MAELIYKNLGADGLSAGTSVQAVKWPADGIHVGLKHFYQQMQDSYYEYKSILNTLESIKPIPPVVRFCKQKAIKQCNEAISLVVNSGQS